MKNLFYMGSDLSVSKNCGDKNYSTSDSESESKFSKKDCPVEKAEMSWKKPSRFTLFTEDFYCPMISDATQVDHCHDPYLPVVASPSCHEKLDYHDGTSENFSESLLCVNSTAAVLDENCNVIQEDLFQLKQDEQDDDYCTQEEGEIDMKVANAISADPSTVRSVDNLHADAEVADAWTNTSQSHLLDAASGTSQGLMVECGAGMSQAWMVECGIQTSQDFGLRSLKYEKQTPEKKQRSTSPVATKSGGSIILPRLPTQTSGPEVPAKIRRIDENFATIYSVSSDCYDFNDSNKENSIEDARNRGYKTKGGVTRDFIPLKTPIKPMDDGGIVDENEGHENFPSSSSRGTFLRVGLSKRSRALKPLHARVPFRTPRELNIPTTRVSKNDDIEEDEDDDE
ncbi:unnamed protein product [Orchesella dallaii]|uniref:Uncharacterized protein n=1 Tax=Orchesella dallaii TaxID=48710 RepID=A0ABP1PKA9_9HEXA